MKTTCPLIPVPDELCSPMDRLAGRCPDAIKNWFRVENAAALGTTPVDIVIDGPIVDPFMAEMLGIGVSSTQVVDAILSLRGQPLTVWINSEGGLITAGLAIYNQLLMHDAPVTTVVYGAAMSIASLIAMAGSPVIMAPASFLFIHEARNELDGTASDHRTQADLLDQLSDQIAGVYARRGDSRVNWRALMQAGTGALQGTLITAEDAVRRKLADRIDTSIARQAVNLVDLQPYRVGKGAASAVNMLDPGPAQWIANAVDEPASVSHQDDPNDEPPLNATNAMAGDTSCCDASGCSECADCGDCADCESGDGCDCTDCPAKMGNSNTLTIRAAERALRDAGFSNSRAKLIVAKGWRETDRDDPPKSSGMDEPEAGTNHAQPISAAAQALIEARQREAYFASKDWAIPMTKG